MPPESLPLAAVSLTWRDAPTSVRARVTTPVTAEVWQQLRGQGARGLVELHTCARSLWIVSGEAAEWLAALVQASVAGGAGVTPAIFVGAEAVTFVLRVASGLESFSQGEADVGRQIAAAFAEGRTRRRTDAVMHALEQSCAALVARGQGGGWVRTGRGVGAVAVGWLAARGIDPGAPIGIVGAGAIGGRVAAAVRREGWVEPVVYNRTVRAGVRGVAEIATAGHDAWVVCTAGPEGWLARPSGTHVLDLGVPAQVRGASVGLDALLGGEASRLDAEAVDAADRAVVESVASLSSRLRSIRRRRSLSGATRLRDRFLASDLEPLLEEGLAGLDADHRKRVVRAAEAAIRRYNHEVVAWLRAELGEGA